MSFTFKRTGDADYPRYLKVLVMGPPKSGKTTFASTAPNAVVAALPDAGLMSIAHKNVPYVDITDTSTLQTLLLILGDPTMRAKAAQQLGLPTIETVIIDTLDALQEIQKKEILKANKTTEMRQADWGKLKETLGAIVKGFVALDLNVIFTVHTATTQDDEQRLIQTPALQGSIKDEIAGWVDFSLLSERKRELDPSSGLPVVKYYLKAEGDQKNPHLGNRAAGRLPEFVEPDFMLLHKAVFEGINFIKTAEIPSDITVTPSTPVSAPEPTPSASSVSQPAPTGVPTVKDDTEEPVSPAGIKALTKHFVDLKLTLPEFTDPVWTLGFARETARMFVAVKADAAEGKGNPQEEMISYFEAWEINGVKPSEALTVGTSSVQTSVQTEEAPKKPRKKPAAAVTQPDASAESSTSASADETVTEKAVELVENQLGAVVIGEKINAGAKCAECDKPVDDLDVANLAFSRFRRPLCVADYMAANKK